MKPILMSLDPVQQRPDLARAPAFIPLRKARAEMQTKNACLASGGNDLEKGMTRACRIMPLVIIDFRATQKTDRVISSCRPERKLRRLRETLNYIGIDCLLKNNQVRRQRNDRFRKRLFPSATPKAD